MALRSGHAIEHQPEIRVAFAKPNEADDFVAALRSRGYPAMREGRIGVGYAPERIISHAVHEAMMRALDPSYRKRGRRDPGHGRPSSQRTVGDAPSEFEVFFEYPETAEAFRRTFERTTGFSARPGNTSLSVIVFVPPLRVEEQQKFGVKTGRDLVSMIDQRVRREMREGAAEFFAQRLGDSQRYRFKAHSLASARQHAVKHLGADVEVWPVTTARDRSRSR